MYNIPRPQLALLLSALLISINAVMVEAKSQATVYGSDEKYSDKIVVITGASSGFGRGVALELACRGASVVLAARRKDALDRLVTICGEKSLAVQTDVSKESDVRQLAQAAVKRFGRIDVWINDAGVGAIGRFADIPLEDQRRIVETNLIGTVNGSYFAMQQFRQQRGGTLINVSSVAGKIPLAYYQTYSASKAAVTSLDAALVAELAADKIKSIHVCTVAPMAVRTPFFVHAANYSGHIPNPRPLYESDNVVNAIVKLVANPKKHVAVGGAAKAAIAIHILMPGKSERVAAKYIRKNQFEKSLPSGTTSGSLHVPMSLGESVEMDPHVSPESPVPLNDGHISR